jgi:hypothetical protein
MAQMPMIPRHLLERWLLVTKTMSLPQNNEPAMTQENHKVNSVVPADHSNIELSESSVELGIHKINDAKLVSD